MKKFISIISLLAALMLVFTSCKGNDKTDKPENGSSSAADTATSVEVSTNADGSYGKGEKTFKFMYAYVDGNGRNFVIHTDKKTVGEALVENGIISGENDKDGMTVKIVDGYKLDKDFDGRYWAFYVNNKPAEKNVAKTEIIEDATYAFLAQ